MNESELRQLWEEATGYEPDWIALAIIHGIYGNTPEEPVERGAAVQYLKVLMTEIIKFAFAVMQRR